MQDDDDDDDDAAPVGITNSSSDRITGSAIMFDAFCRHSLKHSYHRRCNTFSGRDQCKVPCSSVIITLQHAYNTKVALSLRHAERCSFAAGLKANAKLVCSVSNRCRHSFYREPQLYHLRILTERC